MEYNTFPNMLKVKFINLSMRIPKKIMFQFFLKVSFSFSKDIKETVRGRDEYSLILVITDFINQLNCHHHGQGVYI